VINSPTRGFNERQQLTAPRPGSGNFRGRELEPNEGLRPTEGSPLIQLAERLEVRARDFEQLGILVNGAALSRVIAQELRSAISAEEDRPMSLAEAAAHSGYSEAHLRRLVKLGRLRTLRPPGTRGRLRFRLGDLPRKPGKAHTQNAGVHELASRLFGGKKEGHHGRS
jgi:hypothetical protein